MAAPNATNCSVATAMTDSPEEAATTGSTVRRVKIFLRGGDGNDQMEGGAGADSLKGGLGQDKLHGGLGADLLDGGGDRDFLYGGADDDTLIGGLLYDAFIAVGADPQMAVCTAETLYSRTTEADLIAAGIAEFTDEALEPVIQAAMDCGFDQETIDAALAQASGG